MHSEISHTSKKLSGNENPLSEGHTISVFPISIGRHLLLHLLQKSTLHTEEEESTVLQESSSKVCYFNTDVNTLKLFAQVLEKSRRKTRVIATPSP